MESKVTAFAGTGWVATVAIALSSLGCGDSTMTSADDSDAVDARVDGQHPNLPSTSPSVSVDVDIPDDAAPPARDPEAGIYGIWYGHNPTVLSSPYLRGGQVVVQWSDCEPEEGHYDFSAILQEVESLCQSGHTAIVQVNGSDKPDYLFDKVPYLPEKVHQQVKDEKGSLMFWHPTFRNAYLDFISAYAAAVKASPASDCIKGIRQNFNCFGTEICWINGLYATQQSEWVIPAGVSYVQPTQAVIEQYQQAVLSRFLSAFTPEIPVFVRVGISDEAIEAHASFFEDAMAGWFQTCDSLEPNYDCQNDSRYTRYLAYCKPGITFGFAERSAARHTELGTGAEYWRVLGDLHFGVSYIGTRGHVFESAANGNPWTMKTLEMANTYAGYHALPAASPGAWIAFRGKGTNYSGDYTFHMTSEPNPSLIDRKGIGGTAVPYGVWAQELPEGQELVVTPDPDFLASLSAASLKVIWFDRSFGGGTIAGRAGDFLFTITPNGTGAWRETTFALPETQFDHIVLRAKNGSVIFHMVAVVREMK